MSQKAQPDQPLVPCCPLVCRVIAKTKAGEPGIHAHTLLHYCDLILISMKSEFRLNFTPYIAASFLIFLIFTVNFAHTLLNHC